MPDIRSYTCQQKREHGKDFCLDSCPATTSKAFAYARVLKPEDLPPADPRVVDVAILDMNHGWPNLGHDSLVHAVQDAACDLIPVLQKAGLTVRALSFEVRARHQIPEGPGGRFALYLGTGGPGHLDPNQNDGMREGSQGIVEDPAWEEPLFQLFDHILAGRDSALLGVCHSFGVMCRWSRIARPLLRSSEKGGKSAGIQENVLTEEATRHPWFSQLSSALTGSRRIRVVDHRLYDLIPTPGDDLPARVMPIGHEAQAVGGPPGEALTMVEWARDRAGVMPRVFGVNHHPEIVDRSRQLLILREKLERGEVSAEWCEERARIMGETYPDDARDHRLQLTSEFTLMGPLRYHLYRQVRLRATALARPVDLHEDGITGLHGVLAVAPATGRA
jgi:hypothetical protein